MAVSFKTWNTSFQDLLALKVSIDKSAAVLMGLTLYVTWCFSLTTFSILASFSILIILIIICPGEDLSRSCMFAVLNISWMQIVILFPATGNFELWIFWNWFYTFRMRLLPSLLTVYRYNMKSWNHHQWLLIILCSYWLLY